MSDVVLSVVLVSTVALGVSLALAPLETLRWWAGWLGPSDEGEGDGALAPPAAAPDEAAPRPTCFVVFLSGIGSISGDELLPQERAFLDRLAAHLPGARIVPDVFPYAPSGRPLLTGQRVFTRVWRLVDRMRLRNVAVLPALLNLRNLFQVMVSADDRYGPIYSFAMARMIRDGLARHGYRADRAAPVVLLGFSGGGQISVGAATYLGEALSSPVTVVTIGGVVASDRGLLAVHRLTCLVGARDHVQRIGAVAFPGRWGLAAASAWNQARAAGRIEIRTIGPMGHAGRGGYMDERPAPDGGPPFALVTVEAVAEAVARDLAEVAAPVAR